MKKGVRLRISFQTVLSLSLVLMLILVNSFVGDKVASVLAEEARGDGYVDFGFNKDTQNFTARAKILDNKMVEVLFDFSHWGEFKTEAELRGVNGNWTSGVKLQANDEAKTYTATLSFADVKSLKDQGFKIYIPSLGEDNAWIPSGVDNNPRLPDQLLSKIEEKELASQEDEISAFKKKYNHLLTMLEENVTLELVEEIDEALDALGKLTPEQREKLSSAGEYLTKLKDRIRSLEKEFKEVEEFINTYKDLLIDRKPDSATAKDRERVEEALEKYYLLSEFARKKLKPMLGILTQYDEMIKKLEPKEDEEQEETPEKKDKEEDQEKPEAPSTSPEKQKEGSKPSPETKPQVEPKPSISLKSTNQDLTKEARTTSGKIKINVDEESAKLVGAKEIEIKAHSYAKTAGFNPINHELYDISLLDKDGNKITEYKRGFEAEVLLPVRTGREVLAVKHFLDPKDSTKQEKVPSEEVEIAGQKYRKIKVSHFSVYGIEYKPVSEGKDKLPDTGASTGAASALVMLMGLGIAFFTKKK